VLRGLGAFRVAFEATGPRAGNLKGEARIDLAPLAEIASHGLADIYRSLKHIQVSSDVAMRFDSDEIVFELSGKHQVRLETALETTVISDGRIVLKRGDEGWVCRLENTLVERGLANPSTRMRLSGDVVIPTPFIAAILERVGSAVADPRSQLPGFSGMLSLGAGKAELGPVTLRIGDEGATVRSQFIPARASANRHAYVQVDLNGDVGVVENRGAASAADNPDNSWFGFRKLAAMGRRALTDFASRQLVKRIVLDVTGALTVYGPSIGGKPVVLVSRQIDPSEAAQLLAKQSGSASIFSALPANIRAAFVESTSHGR